MRHRTLWILVLSLGLAAAAGCADEDPVGSIPDGGDDVSTDAEDGSAVDASDGGEDVGDTTEPDGDDVVTDGDGESIDGDGESIDGDGSAAETCNYQGKSKGVCTEGTPGGDAGCQAPDDYEENESSCDGIDNDCDGVTDEQCPCNYKDKTDGVCKNSTRDGEGNCQKPEDYESDESTCDSKDNDCDGVTNEGCTCLYNNTNEGVCAQATKSDDGTCQEPSDYEQDETTCDSKDNDCDGTVDEGCTCTPGETESCYTGPSGTAGTGICSEGTRTCDSDGTWGSCTGDQTPKSETCDGKDNDCDGVIDEGCQCDYTGTSDGVCSNGTIGPNGNCTEPGDYEQDETTCDGKDNDCDGVVDENCPCAYNSTSTGVCSNGTISEQDGTCEEPADYESDETTCDGKDNDCDGTVDEGCTCTPGETESCYTGPSGTEGVGVCEEGTRTCQSDGTWGPCQNETTPSSETCDDKDNDCDGTVDEGCPCTYDSDMDGETSDEHGVCENQTIDSSGNCPEPTNYEDPESTCYDGLDNDCDGDTDCQDGDCTGKVCGDGNGGAICQQDKLCHEQDTEQYCTDGTDNDLDGNTDCADRDCNGVSCGTGRECCFATGSCELATTTCPAP